jgi:flagellar hook assembly protein FlgD
VDGRRVRTLVRGTLPAGTHTFEWDRGNDQGTRVGPGLYFVRLTTVQGRFTHKLSIVQ